MRVYRIAKRKYSNDLSGEGAKIFGGRWNKKGRAMLYFSESLPLAVLEILVHLDFKHIPHDFYFIEAEIPDKLIKPKLTVNNLDSNWSINPPSVYTQQIGANWLKENENLAMQVPSTILPTCNNILVNPKHDLIKELVIIKTEKLIIDNRVF